MAAILLIDDDDDLADYLGTELKSRGHRVERLAEAEVGPDRLAAGDFDLVLLDNCMPRMSGLEFLEALQQRGSRVPVVLMTSHATTAIAIQAMNLGAFDYVVKPIDYDELVQELESPIARAAAISRAMKEHVRLPGEGAAEGSAGTVLLGQSKPMLEVYKLIGRVARSSTTVLILGETGTGKELVARAIHSNSPRQNQPFVAFNCDSQDEGALGELFGYEEGAFRGADKLSKGVFEHAHGGTLFLDKVADLPLTWQATLLRVLECREVRRRGGRSGIPIDVRLLAANRHDLESAVQAGRFREDLYYRLQEVTIRLPPLRDRGADLCLLARHFATRTAEEHGRAPQAIPDDVLKLLRANPWPGNVRELRNTIRRAVLVAQGPHLAPEDIEVGLHPASDSQPGSKDGASPPAVRSAASQAPGPPGDAGEEEARAGLQQAIRWALNSGRPNPASVLHEMLDREWLQATLNGSANGHLPCAGHLAHQLANLRQSGLLDPDQQDELDRQQLAGRGTPQTLANDLLRRGWVTPWQLGELTAGRGQDLVLGQYVLLDVLGQGGMGMVFKARQRRLKRLTALKSIRPERLDSPSAVQRFHRETEAAARLAHPNIVQVYDAGEVNGRYFLAMEYVEGTDLARLLGEQKSLSISLACDYARQTALGLQHAHEKGMVHRDVKPSNLLLTARGGVVKILDFGLARLTPTTEQDATGDQLTQTGMLMGTPDYIAPEQAMNAGTVDIRADLYSLGCTLYHFLAGQVPFGGTSIPQKLLQHQMEIPLPLECLRPEVPLGVVRVVGRLMAKRPEDRYQTPAEVVTALEQLAQERDGFDR